MYLHYLSILIPFLFEVGGAAWVAPSEGGVAAAAAAAAFVLANTCLMRGTAASKLCC